MRFSSNIPERKIYNSYYSTTSLKSPRAYTYINDVPHRTVVSLYVVAIRKSESSHLGSSEESHKMCSTGLASEAIATSIC